MIKIEEYWCENVPSLSDIEEAFNQVKKNNVVVKINWFVKYNGCHDRIITKDIIEGTTAKEYFEDCIPHVYGI